MFKSLEKWLLIYITVFIIGFTILAIGLSFSFREFFHKQEQSELLNSAMKVENALLDTAEKKDDYFNYGFYNRFNLINAYVNCSIIVLDDKNNVKCFSDNLSTKMYDDSIKKNFDTSKYFQNSKENYKWMENNFNGIFENNNYTLVYRMLIGNNQIGTVIVGNEKSKMGSTIFKGCLIIFVFVLVTYIIGFFVLRLFIHRFLMPVVEMGNVTADIASGNFNRRIDVGDGDDEVSTLGRNLNAMADSLSDQEQKRQEFLSDISHDLRSPLTSIMGYVQAILDGVVPPNKINKYLQIIYDETVRLNKLSNNILDLSKSKLSGSGLKYRMFDINELIEIVGGNLSVKAKDKNITLEYDIEENYIEVYADYDKIQRVIHNILDNAIKFTQKGGRIILKSTTADNKAFISVIDNGIGMTEEEQTRVFDRLYKADSSRGMDKTGSGLGLCIAKEFIDAHNEEIYVKSKQKQGSTFTFTLNMVDQNNTTNV